jgi:thioredoxin reductase
MNSYDVVVIGGGAAGLSAALVLTRAQRRVAVVDAGVPRNAPASHLHGDLGSDGLPPSGLLAAGRREVAGYGGDLVSGAVATLERYDAQTSEATADSDPAATAVVSTNVSTPPFRVTLEDGQVLRARRVLVTTGLRDDIPDVLGVAERWGRDLLHCPYCHGHEVRDQPLGVLGGTAEAVTHALLIRQWSSDIVYFANGDTLSADEREQLIATAIGVVAAPVARLVVDNDQLIGVELTTGEVVPREAVFVRPVFVPHDDLLTHLGCATSETGWVRVDDTGRTSVPGVWAAGNVVNPRAQVITAAGDGSAAAIAINNDLVGEDTQTAVSRYRLGLPL